MAYDRYDTRHPSREPRSRYISEGYDRSPDSGYSRSYDARHDRDDRDERGFFDRAGDEISSWFGDEDAERRRRMDRNEDRYERGARYREDSFRRPYSGPYGGRQQFGMNLDPERGGAYGYGYTYGRGQVGEPRAFRAGYRDYEDADARGMHDRDYSNWRNRQIDALDRDYEDFRQENSSRFENEFTAWRSERQGKRQLLRDVHEHMDVLGADKQPVGKVDYVKGDRVVLTKSDSPDDRHHIIPCSRIDKIEKDKLILDQNAEEVKQRFSQQGERGALFDRDRDDDARNEGPHQLNRSFSGTY